MAAPVNSLEFFSLVEKSQLLDQELVAKLRPQIASQKSADPKKLAMTFLKNQLLTEYQARQLLSGKNKGFYLARYKIMELLGSGGMGRVYLAEQLSMERLVAIKLISLQKGKKRQDQALARFKREAKAVATLRHPNIIQAFDYADENGLPYFVMEYVEGIDTARIVHRFGPVHWKQASEFGRQAAEGLQHAHEAGLVHRDIKPGNLLVDSSGLVKVLDLGLVSAFDQKGEDALTVDQDQLGTVDYIAPEQALDSKSVDARSDIYGLGATLYSIMSGRILFPDKTTAQKLLMHQTTEPEPITNLVKDIPADLAAVIHKMLAKKPEDRFQTAEDVARALKPFAEPKSPPYELNAIKHRRSIFEGFLGKSPEPGKITVPTLGSPDLDKPAASASRDGNSRSSSQLRPSSTINVESSDPVVDDFTSLIAESSQMQMEMPSYARKKRKPKKREGFDAMKASLVAVALVGLVVMAWLGAYAIRAMASTEDFSTPIVKGIPSPSNPGGQVVLVPQSVPVPSPVQVPSPATPVPLPVTTPQPASVPTTQPMTTPEVAVAPQPAPMPLPSPASQPTAGVPAAPSIPPASASPTAMVNTQTANNFAPASETTWRIGLARMVTDISLQVCYSFDESTISGTQVRNLAQITSGTHILHLVGNPEVTAGRFPGKKAIRFNQSAGKQYAELEKDDSNRLQLAGRFTIAVWFKVESFDRPLQTLISKGASGWRIRRNPDSDGLGIQYSIVNKGQWQLNGNRPVNDGRWHQIVAVNAGANSSLFLDGNLDCVWPHSASSGMNTKRVWIAGVHDQEQADAGFNGWIDEVGIWNRDLKPEEIQQLYIQGNPAQ